MTKSILLAAALGAAAMTVSACDSGAPAANTEPAETQEAVEEPAGPQIMEVLASREDMGTLTQLLQQANLGPALEGAADVTLLAPTDEAFEKVEPSTLEFLSDPANAGTLRNVLGFHLLRSTMTAEALGAAIDGGSQGEATMTTSNNYRLTARRNDDGDVVIVDENGNEAKLVATDLEAVNGIVHVVDTVLMPPSG